MKTIRDISGALRSSVKHRAVRQSDLRSQAGISQRTLTNVLSGNEDFKVSTLLALADRLGLELALVPKEAAVAVEAGPTTAPRVKSRVAAALEKVRAARSAAPTVSSVPTPRADSPMRLARGELALSGHRRPSGSR